jgi:hypothetical protein
MQPGSNHFRPLYVISNAVLGMAVGAAAVSGAASEPRALYVIALFALCSSPLLWMRRFNDRFALLALFFAIYFVFFGNIDLQVAVGFAEIPTPPHQGVLTATEGLILAGGTILLLAYHLGLALSGRGRPPPPARDWSPRALLLAGLAVWILGCMAVIALQVFVIPEKTNLATGRGLTRLGPWLSALVILGNYLQTLGLLILGYGYATGRRALWFPVIVVVIVGQVFMGLLADIKGMALMGLLVVLLSSFVVKGRVPWKWLLVAAVSVAILFPVLQAYRGVLAGGGIDRQAALQDFGKLLSRAVDRRDKVMTGSSRRRAQTLFERSNLKPSVQVAVENTGVSAEFQHGHTIVPLLSTFVPRLIWKDKPSIAVGQVFGQEFVRGVNENTYISPSHLGELYWNYGWSGALAGMALIGLVFGVIGARCDLSRGASVSRVLVLLSTVLLVGLGFESTIAAQYSVWLRSLAVIGLLHLALARRPARAPRRVPRRIESRIAEMEWQEREWLQAQGRA